MFTQVGLWTTLCMTWGQKMMPETACQPLFRQLDITYRQQHRDPRKDVDPHGSATGRERSHQGLVLPSLGVVTVGKPSVMATCTVPVRWNWSRSAGMQGRETRCQGYLVVVRSGLSC